MKKRLPVGIERFEEFIRQGFYYVDKTGLIIDLLNNWGKVNLFTRPRRFGKSLNMSMLKAFFEIGCDKTLFDGLKISQENELCDRYMGKYPVISITLKGVDGMTFEAASAAMRNVIGKEALRFEFLLKSTKLSDREKEMYAQLVNVGSETQAIFSMSDAMLSDSLQTLSGLLCKHYERRVILLIDEYDVPLDKAFQNGFYDEMVFLMRNLLGNVLKTNENLYFAVLTGCLRISKESIFTGLNNLKTHSVTDSRFDECFGFTDADVKNMLEYYGLTDHAETVREWYDGYRFGNTSVYCPWDVINYCDALLADSSARPKNYWANTSGNAMVRRFIDRAAKQTRDEIEQLIAGKSIIKEINQELTYNELDDSIDHLWSVLFTTGYLTQKRRADSQEEKEKYELAIPNREIRSLFISQIQSWFKESARTDQSTLEQFCRAFPEGNAALIEKLLDEYLWNSISIRDAGGRAERKENFYHGMLLGLLQYENNWVIKSNAESGEGYSDILIRTPERIGVVIEIKYAQSYDLETWCERALEQIEEKRYEASLIDDGMKTIVKYGIAFYKKNCKVAVKR